MLYHSLIITFSFAGMIRIRFKGFDLSPEGTPKVHVSQIKHKIKQKWFMSYKT